MKSDSPCHRRTPCDDIVQSTWKQDSPLRGGYTAPKIFSVNCDSWTSILDFDQVEVSGGCPKAKDGEKQVFFRWMPDGCPDHENFDIVPEALQHTKRFRLRDFPAKYLKKGQKVPKKRGIVYVSNDKKTMYCPYTGEPLTVWPWPE